MERNIIVDKLKGYACLLVLFGHVIKGIRLAGVNIPSFFEGIEKFVWSFHVALFFFLSGVLYKETGEWRTKKTKPKFIIYKLINLGVPYVVFSVVYILINSFVGEVNTKFSALDVLNIWKTPVGQYWFLYALFFLFFIWTVFSGILKNWQIMVLSLLVGYGLPSFGIGLGNFDIVFYSALAFGVGTFIDFKGLIKIPTWLKCIIVLSHLSVGFLFVLLGIIETAFIKEIMMLFGVYSSIMLIALIQEIKPISAFLLFVSKYSFQIYLLHTIFTAGIRIVLIRLNITQWLIHVVAGVICGIVFSILTAIIVKKIRIFNLVFFPTKTYQLLKEKQ